MMAVKTITTSTALHGDQALSNVCYLLDTTSNDITMRLTKAEDCIGEEVWFYKTSASNSLTVSTITGQVIATSSEKGSVAATGNRSRIGLVSTGTYWSVIMSVNFA